MDELPPSWAFKIYSKLYVKFKDKKFSNEEAQKITKNNNLNQGLSRLKRDGWLKIYLDPKNSRKSLYQLNNPEDIIYTIIVENAKAN